MNNKEITRRYLEIHMTEDEKNNRNDFIIGMMEERLRVVRLVENLIMQMDALCEPSHGVTELLESIARDENDWQDM